MQSRRFGLVPAVSIILKVLAILLIAFSIYIFVMTLQQRTLPELKDTAGWSDKLNILVGVIGNLVQNLLSPLVFWGLAELFLMTREVEFNTRVAAGPALTEIEAVAAAVEPYEEVADSGTDGVPAPPAVGAPDDKA